VSAEAPELLARCLALLEASGLPHAHRRHPPARSSEEAAALRGESAALGAKSLCFKAAGRPVLVAARVPDRVDNRALRHALGAQKMRFATPEELLAWTGCAPGRVPPIGPPLLDLPLYADARLLQGERLWFTCGTATDSIGMAVADWVAFARPQALPLG
jgi:prolyl-tRNA editing enzyme YbaK/EbsC (Cys-tRNA(Pro) deacylase)